jgi:hypothetical protein
MMRKKVGDLARGLDPLRCGKAVLNLFFMTSSDAQCMLKKLINSVLDHLDDNQALIGIQDLSNDTFVPGFRVGYTEAWDKGE